ncbi:hypothetical protein T439DRAFT_329779 [Meredithblackwellia eburnea MCA 4105]
MSSSLFHTLGGLFGRTSSTPESNSAVTRSAASPVASSAAVLRRRSPPAPFALPDRGRPLPPSPHSPPAFQPAQLAFSPTPQRTFLPPGRKVGQVGRPPTFRPPITRDPPLPPVLPGGPDDYYDSDSGDSASRRSSKRMTGKITVANIIPDPPEGGRAIRLSRTVSAQNSLDAPTSTTTVVQRYEGPQRQWSELESMIFKTAEEFTKEAFAIAKTRNFSLLLTVDRSTKSLAPFLHMRCASYTSGCPFILKLALAKDGRAWELKGEKSMDVGPNQRSYFTCKLHGTGSPSLGGTGAPKSSSSSVKAEPVEGKLTSTSSSSKLIAPKPSSTTSNLKSSITSSSSKASTSAPPPEHSSVVPRRGRGRPRKIFHIPDTSDSDDYTSTEENITRSAPTPSTQVSIAAPAAPSPLRRTSVPSERPPAPVPPAPRERGVPTVMVPFRQNKIKIRSGMASTNFDAVPPMAKRKRGRPQGGNIAKERALLQKVAREGRDSAGGEEGEGKRKRQKIYYAEATSEEEEESEGRSSVAVSVSISTEGSEVAVEQEEEESDGEFDREKIMAPPYERSLGLASIVRPALAPSPLNPHPNPGHHQHFRHPPPLAPPPSQIQYPPPPEVYAYFPYETTYLPPTATSYRPSILRNINGALGPSAPVPPDTTSASYEDWKAFLKALLPPAVASTSLSSNNAKIQLWEVFLPIVASPTIGVTVDEFWAESQECREALIAELTEVGRWDRVRFGERVRKEGLGIWTRMRAKATARDADKAATDKKNAAEEKEKQTLIEAHAVAVASKGKESSAVFVPSASTSRQGPAVPASSAIPDQSQTLTDPVPAVQKTHPRSTPQIPVAATIPSPIPIAATSPELSPPVLHPVPSPAPASPPAPAPGLSKDILPQPLPAKGVSTMGESKASSSEQNVKNIVVAPKEQLRHSPGDAPESVSTTSLIPESTSKSNNSSSALTSATKRRASDAPERPDRPRNDVKRPSLGTPSTSTTAAVQSSGSSNTDFSIGNLLREMKPIPPPRASTSTSVSVKGTPGSSSSHPSTKIVFSFGGQKPTPTLSSGAATAKVEQPLASTPSTSSPIPATMEAMKDLKFNKAAPRPSLSEIPGLGLPRPRSVTRRVWAEPSQPEPSAVDRNIPTPTPASAAAPSISVPSTSSSSPVVRSNMPSSSVQHQPPAVPPFSSRPSALPSAREASGRGAGMFSQPPSSTPVSTPPVRITASGLVITPAGPSVTVSPQPPSLVPQTGTPSAPPTQPLSKEVATSGSANRLWGLSTRQPEYSNLIIRPIHPSPSAAASTAFGLPPRPAVSSPSTPSSLPPVRPAAITPAVSQASSITTPVSSMPFGLPNRVDVAPLPPSNPLLSASFGPSISSPGFAPIAKASYNGPGTGVRSQAPPPTSNGPNAGGSRPSGPSAQASSSQSSTKGVYERRVPVRRREQSVE